MKYKYIIIFTLPFIFLNCPSPAHNYIVVKNKNATKDYDIIDNKIMMKVSGRYRWIGESTIYTEIGIIINNGSKNDILVSRQNIFLYSKYFRYTNLTTNEIRIISKSRDAVMLEYSADYNPSILQEPFKIPNDEEIYLKLDGFIINGKKLNLEEIYLKPETTTKE